MASWIVMEPAGSGRAGNATDAAFVRDGFSFLAFLVPPLWLLATFCVSRPNSIKPSALGMANISSPWSPNMKVI